MRVTTPLLCLVLAGCNAGGIRAFGAAAEGYSNPRAPAHAGTVTAYRTGASQNGPSVTGQLSLSCEYRYGSTVFWRTFAGSQCPYTVEIQ